MLFHIGLRVERSVAYQTPKHLNRTETDEQRINIETRIIGQ